MRRREFGAVLAGGTLWGQDGGERTARRAAIAESLRALEAERISLGDGDYAKWHAKLAPFRSELRALMARERAERPRVDPGNPTVKQYLLRAEGKPPLFSELLSGEYAAPEAPDAGRWALERPVIEAVRATSRWLEKKGIDLIFVPVPKMPDVYMDRIVGAHAPKDGIVNPHLRGALAELLRQDVEVVDLLPAMLREKTSSQDPLFLPADNHWSPAGRAVCVKALAERLGRYGFAKTAKTEMQLYLTQKIPLEEHLSFLALLNEKERAEVAAFGHPQTEKVTLMAGPPFGRPYQNYPTGPVLVTGDSYSGPLGALLAAALNVPVPVRPIAGATVQPVKELLRAPDMLRETKVVVWVVNYAVTWLFDWSGLPDVVKRAG